MPLIICLYEKTHFLFIIFQPFINLKSESCLHTTRNLIPILIMPKNGVFFATTKTGTFKIHICNF